MSDQGVIARPEDELGTPEPSLRDELAHALKGVQERTDETPEAKAARVRDEQGRFAKAEEARKEEAAKPRETLKLPEKPAEEAKPAEAAAPVAKAPDGWTAAAKAKFSELPADIQAEISRREADMHKQFTRQDEERNLGKQIRELTQPYAAVIRAEGGDTLAAYNQFLNTAYIMRTGTQDAKRNALLQVAQQFNVDMSGLLQQQPQQSQAPQYQPQIAAIVQAELDKQRQIQERHTVESSIAEFASAPGHEHFNQLRTVMGALLESGAASDLQDAYDRACYADPEIRSTLAAQNMREAEAKRLSEAQARTDAAKRAAVSVSGGPGGARVPSGAGTERSLGDELRANLRAATGRV